jgi:hypothetical protein
VIKRLTYIVIIISIAYGSTGCNIKSDTKAEKLPLVSPLSERELTDYYKKSMEYDSIVSRRDNVDKLKYEKELCWPALPHMVA